MKKLKNNRSFTLLEMIISIGIFVLVATASSVVFNQGIKAYRFTVDRMAAVKDAEMAMSWIVQRIRPDPGVIAPPILNLAPDLSDATQISVSDTTLGNIHIHRHAADNTIQVEQAATGTHNLLAQNVINLNFGYYTVDNQPANPVTGAAAVEITIVTRVNNQRFSLYNVVNRI